MADLLDLVGLPLVAFGLQVENFLYSFTRKDVVASPNSLAEAKIQQDAPQNIQRGYWRQKFRAEFFQASSSSPSVFPPAGTHHSRLTDEPASFHPLKF